MPPDVITRFAAWSEVQAAKTYIRCPHGSVGDRLWIRETCNISKTKDAVMYLDAGGKLGPHSEAGSESWCREWKTCPSIHMPRWASRITLELTSLRVERVQDISEEDAKAEGCVLTPGIHYVGEAGLAPHRYEFAVLWNRIHGDAGAWSRSDWVWVLGFKRIEQEGR
jgi:hypothetical protein